LIIDAALRLKARSFVIDSEAVWVGEDGVSDFAKLYDGRSQCA
jgi:ATP-dependent DNA ligase